MNRGSKSKVVASAAIFGALSFMLEYFRLEFSFVPLPYLKYSLGEIPLIVAFYTAGFKTALISSLAVVAGIYARGPSIDVIAPLFKLSADISMLIGMYVGAKITKNVVLHAVTGAISRVATMTVVNYIALTTLYAGLVTADLSYVLALTAVFNATHTALDYAAAAPVVKALLKRL